MYKMATDGPLRSAAQLEKKTYEQLDLDYEKRRGKRMLSSMVLFKINFAVRIRVHEPDMKFIHDFVTQHKDVFYAIFYYPDARWTVAEGLVTWTNGFREGLGFITRLQGCLIHPGSEVTWLENTDVESYMADIDRDYADEELLWFTVNDDPRVTVEDNVKHERKCFLINFGVIQKPPVKNEYATLNGGEVISMPSRTDGVIPGLAACDLCYQEYGETRHCFCDK